MKNVLILFIAFYCPFLFGQNNEFKKLLDYYDGERNLIDSITAMNFFDYTPGELDNGLYSDEIILKTPLFIGLSAYLPCGAGGVCEMSSLKTFDYNGIEIDGIASFEYDFADCSFQNDCYCSYKSDSLLILAEGKEEGDCMEDTIFSREVNLQYYYIDESGKIEKKEKIEIDCRREYYFTSCYKLYDYRFIDKSKEDIAIMRNEIFASHGYKFKSKKWQNYFSQKDWYNPLYDDVNHLLNPIELNNIKIILAHEKK